MQSDGAERDPDDPSLGPGDDGDGGDDGGGPGVPEVHREVPRDHDNRADSDEDRQEDGDGDVEIIVPPTPPAVTRPGLVRRRNATGLPPPPPPPQMTMDTERQRSEELRLRRVDTVIIGIPHDQVEPDRVLQQARRDAAGQHVLMRSEPRGVRVGPPVPDVGCPGGVPRRPRTPPPGPPGVLPGGDPLPGTSATRMSRHSPRTGTDPVRFTFSAPLDVTRPRPRQARLDGNNMIPVPPRMYGNGGLGSAFYPYRPNGPCDLRPRTTTTNTYPETRRILNTPHPFSDTSSSSGGSTTTNRILPPRDIPLDRPDVVLDRHTDDGNDQSCDVQKKKQGRVTRRPSWSDRQVMSQGKVLDNRLRDRPTVESKRYSEGFYTVTDSESDLSDRE